MITRKYDDENTKTQGNCKLLIIACVIIVNKYGDNAHPCKNYRNNRHTDRPGSILLADQHQVLILISLKMILDSSKNGRWITPFKKFSRLRVTSKQKV